MCLTLPRTLITLAGIEKVIPRFPDLEVMLQVLAAQRHRRAHESLHLALDRRLRPDDGPQRFHVVLLDNGRSRILADSEAPDPATASAAAPASTPAPSIARPAATPMARVYAGPIGAILTPQLQHMHHAPALPYAIVALRRLLRSLPRQNQHPRSPHRPPRTAS